MSDGSASEGETYEVEKILDKKIVKGKTQYFIKWKGKIIPKRCSRNSVSSMNNMDATERKHDLLN